MTTKKKIAQISGAIIGFIVAFGIMFTLFSKESTEELLSKTAIKINEDCPLKIDEYTRLDSTSLSAPKTLKYYYTLVQINKNQVNSDTIKRYMSKQIVDQIKKESNLSGLKEREISFLYSYYDKNGNFIVEFNITPDMYKTLD